MTTGNTKTGVLLNIALTLTLILLIIVTVKGIGSLWKTGTVEKTAAVAVTAAPEPPQQGLREAAPAPQITPRSLQEVYGNFSKADVGDNAMTEWAKVSAADKAKLVELMDKSIEKSKAMLTEDPDNKKARNILRVSEKMKKLIATDFNYKFESPSHKDNTVQEKR